MLTQGCRSHRQPYAFTPGEVPYDRMYIRKPGGLFAAGIHIQAEIPGFPAKRKKHATTDVWQFSQRVPDTRSPVGRSRRRGGTAHRSPLALGHPVGSIIVRTGCAGG